MAMGVPNSWMVYFMENPNLKWMMTRGTPISGNLQLINCSLPSLMMGENHESQIPSNHRVVQV